MALHLKHFVAACLLGCAVIAVAYLPPQPGRAWDSHTRGTPARQQAFRLRIQVNRAQAEARLAYWRDQLIEEMQRRPSGPFFVRIEPASGARPGEREATERLIRAEWGRLPTPQGSVPVGVSVVGRNPTVGSVTLDRGGNDAVTYVLPQGTGGPCLVIALWSSVGVSTSPNADSGRFLNTRAILGPCAFYATFGRPGGAIEAWLTGGGARYGIRADFEHVPPATRPRRSGGLVSLELPYSAFDLTACVAGDSERCHRMVTDTFAIRDVFSRWQPKPPLAGAIGSRLRGEMAGLYLAHLVQREGSDRFAAFWSSAAPVDSAFAQAFGVSIGKWTAQWAHDVIGNPPRGVRTDRRAVLVSLGSIAFFVALAVVAATRRTVAG